MCVASEVAGGTSSPLLCASMVPLYPSLLFLHCGVVDHIIRNSLAINAYRYPRTRPPLAAINFVTSGESGILESSLDKLS